MPTKENNMGARPKTALARRIFEDIKNLPEDDGLEGESNEFYLRHIMEYLDYLDTVDEAPSWAGLSFFVGYARITLIDKSRLPELAPSLGRFRQLIDMELERGLMNGEGGSSRIFLAKNYGYTDKQTHEVVHKIDQISDDELDNRIKRLEAINAENGSGHLRLAAEAGGRGTEFEEIEEPVYEVIEDGRD